MRIAIVSLLILPACVKASRPPPPALPDPPAAVPVRPPVAASAEDPSAPRPPGEPALPPPKPTGDRERDALELGFWGCHVMGLRLTPSLSGRAWLRATLGPSGEVVAVAAARVEDLPRPVVQCLLDRLARAHFDPRGGHGSVVDVPVDFTRPADPVRKMPGPESQSL